MKAKNFQTIALIMLLLLSLLVISSCTLDSDQNDLSTEQKIPYETSSQSGTEVTSKAYGSYVTESHMEQQECEYESDLNRLKSRVVQQAINKWAARTNTSWASASSQSITFRSNPTFTGRGTYFVYVVVTARPYTTPTPTPTHTPTPPPTPGPECCDKTVIMGAGVGAYCSSSTEVARLIEQAKQKAIAAWQNYMATTSKKYYCYGSSNFYRACDRDVKILSGSTTQFTGYKYYSIYAQAWGRPHLQ